MKRRRHKWHPLVAIGFANLALWSLLLLMLPALDSDMCLPAAFIMLFFTLLMLFGVRRSFAERPLRDLDAGYCPNCGYDLQKKIADGCPECGWGRGAA